MTEFVRQLLLMPEIRRRIGAAPFDPEFRRGLLRSHLESTFLRRRGYPGNLADVAGYKARYCDFATFLFLFRSIFIEGEYFFSGAGPRPFILDCGSNIGMSLLYFKARFPDAEIAAFEPDAAAFACLRENVEMNGLKGVSLHDKAVSGRPGPVDFWRGADRPGGLGNTICANPLKKKVRAEAVALSSYIDRKVDFLKLDVEGAEFQVIEDLARSGRLRLVERMLIECHLGMPGTDGTLSGLLGALETAGFACRFGGVLERPFRAAGFQAFHIYAGNKERTGA